MVATAIAKTKRMERFVRMAKKHYSNTIFAEGAGFAFVPILICMDITTRFLIGSTACIKSMKLLENSRLSC